MTRQMLFHELLEHVKIIGVFDLVWQSVPVVNGSHLAWPLDFGTAKLNELPLVLYLCTDDTLVKFNFKCSGEML